MLHYFVFSFFIIYALWVFFLAVMNLKRAKDAGTIAPVALAFGYPVLLVGYLLDFICNTAVFTVFMMDLPQELTVTARLKRYAAGPQNWRRAFAEWFASNLLNVFDPSGKHV